MLITVVLGLAFIGIGIGMIAFPDQVRGLDRLGNQFRGVKSDQGGAYDFGRIVRGLALIIAGIVMMSLPALLFR